MSNSPPTPLDKFFQVQVQDGSGNDLPQRGTVQFTGGSSAPFDDATNERTVVPLAASSSTSDGQNALTLSSGLNSDIAINANVVQRVTGPSAAFSIGGFNRTPTPTGGERLTIVNTTSEPMTIVQEDASSSTAHRIDTQTTIAIVLPAKKGSATFVYDGVAQRYVLQGVGAAHPLVVAAADFGCTGSGTTDDTNAIQAAVDYALTLLLVSPNGSGFAGVTVQLPAGICLLSSSHGAGTACIELPPNINLRGHRTVLTTTSTTVHLVRSGNSHQVYESLRFVGGKSALVMNGPSWHYGGSLGTNTGGACNVIRDCDFWHQSGPSIYFDSTVEVRGSATTLLVDGGEAQTSCLYCGTTNGTVFRGGTYAMAQNTSLDANAIVVKDDNGNFMPFIVSHGQVFLENIGFTAQTTGVSAMGPAVLGGEGQFRSVSSRYGGEGASVWIRFDDSIVYNGQTLPIDPGRNGVISSFADAIVCASGTANLIEVYGRFPLCIDIRSPTGIAVTGWGIYVDSATCATSTYLNQPVDDLFINYDALSLGVILKVRSGSSPTSLDGTDVTDQLRRNMTNALARGRKNPGHVAKNYMPAGHISFADADSISGGCAATGTPSSASGYRLVPMVAASDQTFYQGQFTNALATIPHGVCTFSFEIEATFSEQVIVYLHNGSTLVPCDRLPFDSTATSNGRQRLATTFFHDGTFTDITVSIFNIPNTVSFTGAFLQLNRGDGVGAWSGPSNAQSDGLMTAIYYVPTVPPTTGSYVTGDQAFATTFPVSGYARAVCIAGGSPGTWQVFDQVPYTPLQEGGVAFQYDAAGLTAGAITKWPDSSGNSPFMDLTGTATATASSGPNSQPDVEFNGSSNHLDVSHSSLFFASEVFLVAKYNATFAAADAIFAGSGTVAFSRPNNTTLQVNDAGGAHTAADSGMQTYSVWHAWWTGSAFTVNQNGVTIFSAVSSTATGIGNTVSMANYDGTGALPGNVSIAYAIGFAANLSSGARTRVINYLQTRFGLTGQS